MAIPLICAPPIGSGSEGFSQASPIYENVIWSSVSGSLVYDLESNHILPIVDFAISELRAQVDRVNWQAEGGSPPNARAFRMARNVLRVATESGYRWTYVTAMADGGVAICFKRTNTFADIECLNEGEMGAMISKRGETPQTWAVLKTSLRNSMERIDAALKHVVGA